MLPRKRDEEDLALFPAECKDTFRLRFVCVHRVPC